MEKQWKLFPSQCMNCGDRIEVLSECLQENDTEFEVFVNDGDDARCESGCGFLSTISADDGNAWLQEGNIEELTEQSNQ